MTTEDFFEKLWKDTRDAWNNIADEDNQWSELDADEKEYLMEKMTWNGELS